MHVDLSHPEFQAAIPILKKIEAAGYEAYFVGGCVRDTLLHLPIHDVDIATSAYPEEVKHIFKRTVDTGIEHGTVMVLDHGDGYEITTFRTESGYQDFRRPDEVTFVRSLKEDQLRRDFTINALAARHDGTIIDNFDGLTDLKHHLLRAVGNPDDRFHEDALRMMRAVRFESQLGFDLEPATAAALAHNAPLLKHIAVERIAYEFERLLLGISRSNGLTSFLNAKLYEYCPGLTGRADAIKRMLELPNTQLQHAATGWLLLAYCLDVPATKLLKGWKQSNSLIRTVVSAQHLLPTVLASNTTREDLYRAGLDGVTIASEAAPLLDATIDAAHIQRDYRKLPIHEPGDMAINGGDLIAAGVAPGREMGRLLKTLETNVLTGKLPNEKSVLLAQLKQRG